MLYEVITEVMKEEGADFVCSGEVIGQRPKSQQRNGMNTVKNNIDELGYEGLRNNFV